MSITGRAALAFAAELTFLVLAIGVRGVLQRRRTGSSGIVLGRMGGQPAEQAVLGGMVLAFLTTGAATIAGLTGATFGGPDDVSVLIVAAGLVLAAVSIAATFWAQLAMGESWRVGLDRSEQTALVTNGPYRWVRNPIYTAMVGCYVGLFLVLPGPVMFVALAAAVAAIEVVVRYVEEPYLRGEHSRAYQEWSAHVGRFVPGIGRLA